MNWQCISLFSSLITLYEWRTSLSKVDRSRWHYVSHSSQYNPVIWLPSRTKTQKYTAKWKKTLELEPPLIAHTHTERFVIYLHFLENNALGMGSTAERIGLPSCTQISLFVIFVGPTLVATMIDVFSGCSQTSWFTCVKTKNTLIKFVCMLKHYWTQNEIGIQKNITLL